MKPSRFTDEQVIGILREQEVGAATADRAARREWLEARNYRVIDIRAADIERDLGQELARLETCLPRT